MPDEAQWRSLQRKLDAHKAKWMIWEDNPDQQSVARLKGLGLNSLVFDPCANTPEEGDFITVMTRNINELNKAFSALENRVRDNQL